MWTIKFRNGTMKRFKFPIRTTPEGSIEPYKGKPAANMADIDKPGFFNFKDLPGDRSQLICL
jgi:adenylylsulfate reductase subunit B